MCSNNFADEFPVKTKELFEWYYEPIRDDTGLEVTFLINCLLGLVCSIYEKYEGREELKYIKLDMFSDSLPDSFLRLSDKKLVTRTKDMYKKLEVGDFLKRIRDGIAHQHISVILDSNGKWDKITIQDIYHKSVNFEITLTIEQLKKLALKISEFTL